MNKKKILILGATGFIGRNIVEYFSKKNKFNITGTYFKTKPNLLNKRIKYIKTDLKNKKLVDNLLKDKEIVIQAAAVTTGIQDVIKRPYVHVTDNAIMNSLLLRSCFENQIKHFIFFSCTTMYPNSEYPIKEDDFNSKIEDKYFGVGWTKVYIEKMLEFYSRISKTKFTAIRHSNIYGPYDKYDLDRSHVFGATVTKVLTSKENNFEVWGDGTEKRDLVYIDDLVKFVELIITKQKKQFELINLGSGKSISIAELVEKIINASSKHLTIRYNNTKPTIKFNLELNIDKATKKYGWKPEVCLDEGIMKTMQWYKKNIKIYDYGKISLKKMIKKNV